MIAWVDVETTGIETRGNALLEVGVILTDDDLRETDRVSVALQPPRGFRMTLSPEVCEMHEASGLLGDCEHCGIARAEAMILLCQWLTERVSDPPVMAGSTVGFDREWLKAKMPLLADLFHYRSIDVSSLKELNKRWRFAPVWTGKRDIHRALPDIEDSIAELKFYREIIERRIG